MSTEQPSNQDNLVDVGQEQPKAANDASQEAGTGTAGTAQTDPPAKPLTWLEGRKKVLLDGHKENPALGAELVGAFLEDLQGRDGGEGEYEPEVAAATRSGVALIASRRLSREDVAKWLDTVPEH